MTKNRTKNRQFSQMPYQRVSPDYSRRDRVRLAATCDGTLTISYCSTGQVSLAAQMLSSFTAVVGCMPLTRNLRPVCIDRDLSREWVLDQEKLLAHLW